LQHSLPILAAFLGDEWGWEIGYNTRERIEWEGEGKDGPRGVRQV